MLVRQLMSRDPKTCTPEDSLDAAARALWDRDLGALPVISGARLVAMLTDRDICMAAYTQGRPLRDLRVSTAMSKGLHVVHPDDQVGDATRLMRERQVRRLPVVDDEGKLLGLLTVQDVTEAALAGDVDAHEALETLAAIAHARRAEAVVHPALVGAAR